MKKRIGQGKAGDEINLRQQREIRRHGFVLQGTIFFCRKANRAGHGECWAAEVRKTKLHVSRISAYKAVLQRLHVTKNIPRNPGRSQSLKP